MPHLGPLLSRQVVLLLDGLLLLLLSEKCFKLLAKLFHASGVLRVLLSQETVFILQLLASEAQF